MGRFWTLLIVFLVVIIAAGSVVTWLRYNPGQQVEISMPGGEEWRGQIYIDGAVNNPGSYPLLDGDSVESLIQAAGGVTDNVNLSGLKLHIPGEGEGQDSQRININRAEVWLLTALPGIGETLAQRIVAYRLENGPYRNTSEITGVSGIGDDTYEQIKDLITVAD
ncbi:helix-hairpin-helix domain-containing protein [Chloroflexota bacterium]